MARRQAGSREDQLRSERGAGVEDELSIERELSVDELELYDEEVDGELLGDELSDVLVEERVFRFALVLVLFELVS